MIDIEGVLKLLIRKWKDNADAQKYFPLQIDIFENIISVRFHRITDLACITHCIG